MSTVTAVAVLAQDTVERTSTGEAVQFWILAVVAVAGAIGVVVSSKAVYSAIFLALTMIVLAASTSRRTPSSSVSSRSSSTPVP